MEEKKITTCDLSRMIKNCQPLVKVARKHQPKNKEDAILEIGFVDFALASFLDQLCDFLINSNQINRYLYRAIAQSIEGLAPKMAGGTGKLSLENDFKRIIEGLNLINYDMQKIIDIYNVLDLYLNTFDLCNNQNGYLKSALKKECYGN